MTFPFSSVSARKIGGLCLAAVLAACAGSSLAGRQEPEEKKESLRPGMTKADVQRLLGPPRQVSRQVLYHRYLEQWHYGNVSVSWIEFECRRGHEAQLQTVHPSKPGDR